LLTIYLEDHNGVILSGTPKLKRTGVIAFNCQQCKQNIVEY